MSDDLRDIATFAERVLRRPLWPHQLEAARADAFITVIAKARRTGGTALAETLASHTAFTNRGCRVLILSATQDAARRLTESIGVTLARSEVTRGAVVEDFATRIILRNGSEIISLPASARQVRGYGEGVLLVILDEAGFMPSELWTAAHYTALDERRNGSRIVMLGTPWGGADHFFRQAFRAGLDADADYSSHHWTAEVNPALDRDYLERMRQRVSPAEYAAEILGEWSDAVGSLFPRALLERQTADLELPAPAALDGDARPIIGCDWGVSFDRSAAALVYRLPVAELNADAEARARFVVLPHVWAQAAPLSDVVSEIAAWPIPFGFIAPETSGVGAMPSQELERTIRQRKGHRSWCHVATTSQKKTSGYGAILALLERGRLVLPRHPDLLRQLAGLRFEQGTRGFMRIEADDAAIHDDVADALMLAALPYSPGKGRVLCGISQLADPPRPIPDAPVPPLDDEVVTTGGGLRVYRRPPLQSVDGQELILPPGARYRDPRAAEHERLRAELHRHLQQTKTKETTNG